MIKQTPRKRKSAKSRNMHAKVDEVSARVESLLPSGSPQRAAAGIAAAAGGALLAAAILGVGPAALAGAAGYLVYLQTHRA